jgi:Cu(I)/Ag(I) efflux system membrane protein CusA/SilA
MKRIAAPMIGGILTSFLMGLIVYPPIFAIWKWNFEVRPRVKKSQESREPEPAKEPELTHA